MLALPSEGKTDQNVSTFNQCLENINFPKIVFFLDKYLNRIWAKSGQQMIIKNRLIQTKKVHYAFVNFVHLIHGKGHLTESVS